MSALQRNITECVKGFQVKKDNILSAAIRSRIGKFELENLVGRLSIITRGRQGSAETYLLDDKILAIFEPPTFEGLRIKQNFRLWDDPIS